MSVQCLLQVASDGQLVVHLCRGGYVLWSSQSDLTWYSLRDQTFAISSAKGLACLRAERHEKEQQNDEKKQKQMEKQKKKASQTKGKAKPQGEVAKKSVKRKFDEVVKEEHV